MQMSDDESPAAPAQRADGPNRSGVFNLPENVTDLVDLFLDADIQHARAEIHTKIERQRATPAAKMMQKAVVDINALAEQGKRDRLKRRAKNER